MHDTLASVVASGINCWDIYQTFIRFTKQDPVPQPRCGNGGDSFRETSSVNKDCPVAVLTGNAMQGTSEGGGG